MRRPAYSTILVIALILSACQGYDYTINDKVVYSPRPLFQAFELPDDALRTCVEQVVADRGVSTAEQLTALNCSHAGIESVEGLAVFQGLTTLKLSNNRIRNLVEIGQLSKLRSLDLADNNIVDPVPLAALPDLAALDLSGNDKLQCPRPGLLDRVATLALPTHCTPAGGG